MIYSRKNVLKTENYVVYIVKFSFVITHNGILREEEKPMAKFLEITSTKMEHFSHIDF